MNSKTCTKCGEDKPFEFFSKAKKGKYGYCSVCKDCIKTYYENNKERILDQNKTYRECTKDSRANQQKMYRESNKERLKIRKAEYYKNNKDKADEYYKNNKERLKLNKDKNKAKETKQNWVVKNKDKIIQYYKKNYAKNHDHIIKKRNEKIIVLSDEYIKGLLTACTTLTAKDIPQELIELKRLELQINRKIKELTK